MPLVCVSSTSVEVQRFLMSRARTGVSRRGSITHTARGPPVLEALQRPAAAAVAHPGRLRVPHQTLGRDEAEPFREVRVDRVLLELLVLRGDLRRELGQRHVLALVRHVVDGPGGEVGGQRVVLALLLLIFAGPIWFVWAVIEMFLPFNPSDAARPFETNVNVSQNVNVPNALPDRSDDDDRVACPQCAEMIKINAVKCRFCGIRV